MKTLHELAIKLQESIIKQQEDSHNAANLNVTKYNNLKIKMDTRYAYPHAIICIGISEAVFNIAEGTKTDGGLGPDEKYVKKWLANSTVISDLKEIYISLGELVKAEEQDKAIAQEGEADEVKRDAPRKKKKFRSLLDMAMPVDGIPVDGENLEDDDSAYNVEVDPEGAMSEDKVCTETVDEIKKDLKSYLKSIFRLGK